MLRDFLSCCAAKSCVVFGKILISANKFGKRLLLKRQQRKRQRKRRRLLSRRKCSFCLGRRESPRLRLPAQGMPYYWHCRLKKLVQISGQNQHSFWATMIYLFGKMSQSYKNNNFDLFLDSTKAYFIRCISIRLVSVSRISI